MKINAFIISEYCSTCNKRTNITENIFKQQEKKLVSDKHYFHNVVGSSTLFIPFESAGLMAATTAHGQICVSVRFTAALHD